MKDQFVIAHITDLDSHDTVISYCQHLSKMLKKGIILLYVADKRYGGPSADEATPQLKELQQKLLQEGHQASYCALTGETKKAVALLPTKLNAVVAVAAVNLKAPRRCASHPKEVLRNYNESKIAYLTVQQPLSDPNSLKSIALTIDFRKESKDKLIWSSYFARFNKSRIVLLSENYKDEGLRLKWSNNIKFLNKFYGNLNLTYEQRTVRRKGPFLDVSAIPEAAANGIGLLISVTTDLRAKDLLELFIGVQEEKTIRNKEKLPILFINPRDDIYVLCD